MALQRSANRKGSRRIWGRGRRAAVPRRIAGSRAVWSVIDDPVLLCGCADGAHCC